MVGLNFDLEKVSDPSKFPEYRIEQTVNFVSDAAILEAEELLMADLEIMTLTGS